MGRAVTEDLRKVGFEGEYIQGDVADREAVDDKNRT